jgi:hypothetical protein
MSLLERLFAELPDTVENTEDLIVRSPGVLQSTEAGTTSFIVPDALADLATIAQRTLSEFGYENHATTICEMLLAKGARTWCAVAAVPVHLPHVHDELKFLLAPMDEFKTVALANFFLAAKDRAEVVSREIPPPLPILTRGAFGQWLAEKLPIMVVKNCASKDEAKPKLEAVEALLKELLDAGLKLRDQFRFEAETDGKHYSWDCNFCLKSLSFKVETSGKPHVVNALCHLLGHFGINLKANKKRSATAPLVPLDSDMPGSMRVVRARNEHTASSSSTDSLPAVPPPTMATTNDSWAPQRF